MTLRVRLCVAPPHVTGHGSQAENVVTWQCTLGHGSVAQSAVSISCGHTECELWRDTMLRVRVCDPVPQV